MTGDNFSSLFRHVYMYFCYITILLGSGLLATTYSILILKESSQDRHVQGKFDSKLMILSFDFINPFLKIVFNEYLSIKFIVLLLLKAIESRRNVLLSFDLRWWQHTIARGLQSKAQQWKFSVLENLSLYPEFTYIHKNLPFP